MNVMLTVLLVSVIEHRNTEQVKTSIGDGLAVTAPVVNGSALDAALSRCKALSMEQRFKSQECAAAGRADTFISLRLPRTVETLKPLKFK
jgi:hypothetical protein